MFKRNGTRTPALLLAGLVIVGSLPVAAEEIALVSSADLPGVPVSITERPRSRTTAPADPEATRVAQEAAAQRMSVREHEIQQTQRQVAQLQGQPAIESRTPQEIQDVVEQLERQIRESDAVQIPDVAVLRPGVNRIIKISRGHPNRIVAPFSNPEVRTTNTEAEITTSGEIIYVATGSEQPVTLFISPKGNERVAASITLLPQAIPPQEIRFRLDAGDEVIRYANPTAERWETRTSYVDTITKAFRALALQDLPQGYTLRNPAPADHLTCYAGDEVSFELGQVAEGHNMAIQIAVATNYGHQPVEIIGSQCAGYRVLAAAEWPRSILEPGQKTEVFIAIQRLDDAEPEIRRPSLIGD